MKDTYTCTLCTSSNIYVQFHILATCHNIQVKSTKYIKNVLFAALKMSLHYCYRVCTLFVPVSSYIYCFYKQGPLKILEDKAVFDFFSSTLSLIKIG